MMKPEVRAAIEKAAREGGVDPAFALAVAERESAGNPTARSSKSIYGVYQMTGGLRRQYGSGDSADPYTQAKAWTTFIKDTKGEMSRVLGRPVTDQEAYLGHHFGAVRAARGLKGDPNIGVDEMFSPYERSINPHFDKAGTIGRLNSNVTADISKRMAHYGGAELPDLSSYGTPVQNGQKSSAPVSPQPIDLSSYGTPIKPQVPMGGSAPAQPSSNEMRQVVPAQAAAYAPAAAPAPAVQAINSATSGAPNRYTQPTSAPVTPTQPPSFGMRGVAPTPVPDMEPLRASSPADLESA